MCIKLSKLVKAPPNIGLRWTIEFVFTNDFKVNKWLRIIHFNFRDKFYNSMIEMWMIF